MDTFDKAVFETGTQTDSAGNTHVWTLAELRDIVARYENRVEDAPIVLGHPEDDTPAYGWVKRLYIKGNQLWATIKSAADSRILDWLKAGYYRMVSISLYEDLSLRHIGFLGGTRPAVAGLPDAKIAGAEAFSKMYRARSEYANYSYTNITKGAFAMPDNFDLAEWQAWRTGIDDTLKAIQTSLSEIKAAMPADANAGTQASEPPPNEQGDPKFSKDNAAIIELQKQVGKLRKENAIASFKAFLNSDDIRPKVAPVSQPSLIKMAEGILESAAPSSFSESGSCSALDSLYDTVKTFPSLVPVGGEFAHKDNAKEVDAVKELAERITKAR